MTLTAAILLILVADIALIAGLAWVMSRPAKLTPHVRVPRAQPRLAPRLAADGQPPCPLGTQPPEDRPRLLERV